MSQASAEDRSHAPDVAAMGAIDAMLRTAVPEDGPGLVIAVARAGATVYRQAFGLANVEHRVPNTPCTRMRIASTTKQFTCLAVLLLAEDGLLCIDTPVRDYLPQLEDLGNGPSLRQLMHHTGGWRCHVALGSIASGFGMQPIGTAMPLLSRQRELNFEPGSQMIYSNGGYLLLTRVIERIGGVGFDEFMSERVFKPLGMMDTEVVSSDLDVRGGLASLYLQLPGGRLRRGFSPAEEYSGDGAIVSTVDDMLTWTAHLRDPVKRVGSPETWRLMLEPAVLNSGLETGYALGLMTHDYRGIEIIHHAGGTIGGASQMLTVPAHDLDIVVLANGAGVSPVRLGFQVLDALLEPVFPNGPQKRARASDFPCLPGARFHCAETGLLIEFRLVGEDLGLSWLGSAPVALRREAGRLWLEMQDHALSPVSMPSTQFGCVEAPSSMTLTEGGQLRTLALLPAAGPGLPGVEEEFQGNYLSHDLDATARVRPGSDGTTLFIQGTHGRHELRLTALSRDVLEARSQDPILRLTGESGVINLDRDATGRVLGFRMDVSRIRHLCFVRQEATNLDGTR